MFHRFLAGYICASNIVMEKAGDPPPGGDPPKPDPAKDMEALRTQNADLLKRLEAIEAKGKPPKDDPDLIEKEKLEREKKDKETGNTKAIESALRFSLGAKDWLKTNQTLLPKEIEGIFAAADKENYSSAIEKDSAIKSSVIQSFFNLQSNMDLLTPSQKSALEDFQKLTKNGKQEKAQGLYDTIFEPTFEMLKRVKKAEQLAKQDHAPGTDTEVAYRDRMVKMSKKHYLGEKQDA